MTSRRPDWRAQLRVYVESVRGLAFVWGQMDCALFVAGAVEAMTGIDHTDGLRGKYDTAASALRTVRMLGYIDHVDMARAKFDEIKDRGRPAPHLAQVGDIAVIPTPAGAALGIVQGPRVFAMGERGLTTIDLLEATMALRV